MNDQTEALTISRNEARIDDTGAVVRQFRHIVLWPLQVLCESGEGGGEGYDELVAKLAPGVWRLVEDEFGDPDMDFQERHYREFVSFLPHVQRFLYGDAAGPSGKLARNEAPLRVYRRDDVARVRMVLEPGAAPVICDVAHIDLYFFHDVDAVILAFELYAEALPLRTVQEILYRFGRAYPPGWDADGKPMHCAVSVEWLDRNGEVLASSDYEDSQRFLSFVGHKRAPRIARHWEYLLRPLAPYASPESAPLRFRLIEYYRMPVMSYLVFDNLAVLTPADHVRLAFAAAPGERSVMPFAPTFLQDFDRRHCYDRFYLNQQQCEGINTRFLSCGHAFTVIAAGRSPFLHDGERGLLGEFRHQQFLLFMIAHFHKAALLMISDRMVAATKLLDPSKPKKLLGFRRETFRLQETFLRFTQRYYFTEVSDQAHSRDLFRLHRGHLGTDDLYRELRGEIMDMVQYLDSGMLRRQSGSMHRLTAVTILGLIGTTATGFLGMNLIAEADASMATKIGYFSASMLVFAVLTFITVAVSRPLTLLFDWVTGEQDGE
jgi:hypothetical protein